MQKLYFVRCILAGQLFVFGVGHNVTTDLLTTELDERQGI